MNGLQNVIPIPAMMAQLPRDKRGYPIPFIVFRDNAGAHFIVNDGQAVIKCAREQLCGICGNPLEIYRTFVGGVRNAFHRNGAYKDPPTHPVCAEYALKVCPFLAVPSYKGAAAEAHTKRMDDQSMVLIDPSVTAGKPILFAAVLAKSEKTIIHNDTLVFRPKHPYTGVQYWRDGVQVPWSEAKNIRDKIMSGEIPPTA